MKLCGMMHQPNIRIQRAVAAYFFAGRTAFFIFLFDPLLGFL